MEHEVFELTFRVTVDAGYPRENSPLLDEAGDIAGRLGDLTGVEGVEATVQHPVDLSRRPVRAGWLHSD